MSLTAADVAERVERCAESGGAIRRVTFSKEARDLARDELGRLWSGREQSSDLETFFDQAEIIEGVMPSAAREALAALRSGDADVVHLRGLPRDGHPGATPMGGVAVHPPRIALTWLAMAVRRLGHEFAYAEEKAGRAVHDVCPTSRGATTQSNASWSVDLGLHTEIAFHPIRPDYIVLVCVRAPTPPPATRVALLDDVLDRLTPAEQAILRQQRFRVRVVDSFLAEGASDLWLPIRVLDGPLSRPVIRWHSSLQGMDPTAESVSHVFAEQARYSSREIALEPGDIVAFANDRCLHGRGRFEASLNGRDRWILRSYALRDRVRFSRFLTPDRPWVVRVDLTSEALG